MNSIFAALNRNFHLIEKLLLCSFIFVYWQLGSLSHEQYYKKLQNNFLVNTFYTDFILIFFHITRSIRTCHAEIKLLIVFAFLAKECGSHQKLLIKLKILFLF